MMPQMHMQYAPQQYQGQPVAQHGQVPQQHPGQAAVSHPYMYPPHAAQQSQQVQPHMQHQQQQQQQQQQQLQAQQQFAGSHMHHYQQNQAIHQHQQPQQQQQLTHHHQQQKQQEQQIVHQAMHQKLVQMNESSWILLGNLAETLGEADRALVCFENALRHNPYSIHALSQVAYLQQYKERYHQAIEYFQRVLNVEQNNGEVWASLGQCYLAVEDLGKAYNSFQQALYYLQNPKSAKLWFNIGLLYDRYYSFDHAEEAFTSVLKIDPQYEAQGEVYFKLGQIYMNQQKFEKSLQCFNHLLSNKTLIKQPLKEVDVKLQIGHIHEVQKNLSKAKEIYHSLQAEHPDDPKLLQQFGWLSAQNNTEFYDLDKAVSLLQKSAELDATDALTHYLLGRCYMQQQKYNNAYDSYQQAVYRDSRNAIFWCSIGVLYYQIYQYRDALDAYTRAIRLNPYISEVWYNLGILYESCNNQIRDALDAYQRAADMDQKNTLIRDRLTYLKQLQSSGGGSGQVQQPGESAIKPPPAVEIDPLTYRPQQPADGDKRAVGKMRGFDEQNSGNSGSSGGQSSHPHVAPVNLSQQQQKEQIQQGSVKQDERQK